MQVQCTSKNAVVTVHHNMVYSVSKFCFQFGTAREQVDSHLCKHNFALRLRADMSVWQIQLKLLPSHRNRDYKRDRQRWKRLTGVIQAHWGAEIKLHAL
jgi:hypothetical protein